MAKEARSILLRYGSALGFTALASMVRVALNPALGDSAPFVTFVVAVAITALDCGLGPALVTTLAGAVIGLIVWVLPAHSNPFTNIIPYLFVGVFISLLIESMRRERRRAEVNAAALNESRKLLSTTLGSIGDA